MKRLVAVLLTLVMFFNLFGILATAEMDNLWNLFPTTGLTYEQQQDYLNRLNAVSNKMLRGIIGNDSLTDVQKALLIHDRIADTCEYDLSLTKRFATDTLFDGVSVCTGYSYAYKFLLEKVGIKCTLETSTVMNHLWNIVYLDGKKYYVDLTFDDPSYDISGRVEHHNFLISSDRFCQTHGAYFNGQNFDFDLTLDSHEYEDGIWNCSDAAFQVVGSDIYYIDSQKGKLMKLGDSQPLLDLTYNWSVGEYYYPGNFSRLATDGYCLYYSDMRSIYKFDVNTKKSTAVYTLGSEFSLDADIFGFTFRDCTFVFEATSELGTWGETTKSEIQKTVSVPHYFGDNWTTDTDSHWRQCLVCGTKAETSSHNFGTEIKNDETTHWYECSVCGVKKDWQEHIYSDSCDSTCNICGYVRANSHTVGDNWNFNNTTHWHVCTSCNQKVDELNHVYDNSCDTTCNVCGYTRTVTHSYSAIWSKDSTNHWHECSICGAKKDNTAHTYDNSCDTTCNVCGYTRTIAHSYKTTWSKDASYHWHECSVCANRKDLASHTWDGGTIVVSPTPEAPGERLRTCTVCGQTKTESVPFVGIGGSIVTYGDSNDDITLTLFKKGSETPIQQLVISSDDPSFMFMSVENGDYTVTVSKKNHVDRTYEVKVVSSTIDLDVEIHLIGDINGDGAVTVADYYLASNHVRNVSLLTGYEFACADVNNSGSITTYDTMRINSHSKGRIMLW